MNEIWKNISKIVLCISVSSTASDGLVARSHDFVARSHDCFPTRVTLFVYVSFVLSSCGSLLVRPRAPNEWKNLHLSSFWWTFMSANDAYDAGWRDVLWSVCSGLYRESRSSKLCLQPTLYCLVTTWVRSAVEWHSWWDKSLSVTTHTLVAYFHRLNGGRRCYGPSQTARWTRCWIVCNYVITVHLWRGPFITPLKRYYEPVAFSLRGKIVSSKRRTSSKIWRASVRTIVCRVVLNSCAGCMSTPLPQVAAHHQHIFFSL